MNYYNENDKFAAQWLRNLIEEKLIPEGIVDDRSIEDVQSKDLKEFNQCHFFAGIGGWAYALQLARWNSDRPVWTGSCPCQSFSVAGQRKGADDERNLWPQWFRLIRESRPATIFGEQVVGAIGFGWLDAVATDLEACDYRFASSVLSGYIAGAYHKRQRLWFVADSDSIGWEQNYEFKNRQKTPISNRNDKNDTIRMADTTNDGRYEGQSNNESRRTQPSCEEGRLFKSERERSHMADSDSVGGRSSRLEKQQKRASVRQRFENSGFNMADSQNSRRDRGSSQTKQKRETTKQNYRRGVWSNTKGQRSHMADTVNEGSQGGLPRRSDEERTDLNGYIGHNSPVDWRAVEWVECGDGKTRPIPLESDVQPLVNGIPEVMDSEGNPRKYSYAGSLKGIGNAIIPQVAAEFISAFLEIE